MALTVGTDTYISLADARQYCTDNDLEALPEDDTEAEKLLRRAAKALDRRWGNRYLGVKATLAQTLAWPRDVAVSGSYRGQGESWMYTLDADGNPRDFNDIPAEMGEAQVEMAVLMQNAADPLQQNQTPVIEKSVEADGVSISKKYATPSQEPAFYRVLIILRPLLKPIGGSISATRGA